MKSEGERKEAMRVCEKEKEGWDKKRKKEGKRVNKKKKSLHTASNV